MGCRSFMIQGTGSNVGKSLIVAGLCRHFANSGLTVRPFKSQNMSNNAAVAVEGGEIGRAQSLQAAACRTEPSIHMNPVLLKPEMESGAQIILQGRIFGTMHAKEYGQHKNELLPKVMESYRKLQGESDLVIVEGAGSPAEVNLRQGDIANMGFAEAADLPVVLVGDIDRGGVIASLVGTSELLEPTDRHRIKAFLINRFRGDASLFNDGMELIRQKTGWTSLGIMPWFENAGRLPAEDAQDLADGRSKSADAIRIAVPVLSRIANFDDLDPLRMESNVDLELVHPGKPIPGDSDLVLLLGTKSTISDIGFFRDQGWDTDLKAHVRRGGRVLGICGGFQMLGEEVSDPDGIEGTAGSVRGLGYLDMKTTLQPKKTVEISEGRHLETDTPVKGYEIHLGECHGPAMDRPFACLGNCNDGSITKDGLVSGTYLHGLFSSDEFRQAFLRQFGTSSSLTYSNVVDQTLDELASTMADRLDLDTLLELDENQSETHNSHSHRRKQV